MIRTGSVWILSMSVLFALISSVAVAGDGHEAKAFMSENWFVRYFDPGIATYSDGNMHIRNQDIFVEYRASNPLVAGFIRGTLNYNLDSELKGQLWGTAQSADANGNLLSDGFVGTCSGTVYDMSEWWILNSTTKCVFHGIGINKGLRFEISEVWDMDLTNPGKKYYAAAIGVLEGEPK